MTIPLIPCPDDYSTAVEAFFRNDVSFQPE